MESLNNDMNEMDALYRRAAENYPLKPGDENWDDILIKLSATSVITAPVKSNKFRKYTGLFLCLFLIIGGVFFYSEFQNDDTRSNRIKQNKNEVKRSSSLEATVDDNHLVKEDHADRSNRRKLKTNSAIKPGTISTRKEGTISARKPGTFSGRKFGNSSVRNLENVSGRNKENTLNQSLPNAENDVAKTINTPINPYDQLVGRKSRSLSAPVSIATTTDSLVSRNRVAQTSILIEVSNIDKPTTQNLSANKKSSYPQRKNGVYLGLTAGPDFSNIKWQGIDRTGYNLGLVAGYRFNEKLSIETGILWNRKKYYTDGKYFNMKAGSMPASMKIVNVQGQLTLFEVPLKIKYDIFYGEKSNFFLSSGILSNIYLKERNNYLIEMNGVQQYQIGLYKDKSYSWLSLVNFSAGYERSLGKTYTIRVEPYIKIPLKEVGVGNLTVLSSGINLTVLNLFQRKKP
jgi:hypothetical protein